MFADRGRTRRRRFEPLPITKCKELGYLVGVGEQKPDRRPGWDRQVSNGERHGCATGPTDTVMEVGLRAYAHSAPADLRLCNRQADLLKR